MRKLTILAAAATAALTISGAGRAQDVISQPSSDLDVHILGDIDPQVRKAQAIVNNDVITDTDVEQRLNLIVAANGGQIDGEERTRLRNQVMRNLIDEKLQIQEAAAKDIKVDEPDIDAAFNRVATNFKQTPKAFEEYLRNAGTSPAAIRNQIRGEIAWSRLLRRKVEPTVNVGDDEVQAVIAKLNATKGSDEYNLRKIFLPATSENLPQVLTSANVYVGEIRGGSSFTVYARQVSEDATRNDGGAIGWVRPGQLSDAVAQVVTKLNVGDVSDPFQVPGGVEIWKLEQKRKVMGGDPGEAVLSLKQLGIGFKPDTSEEQAKVIVANFQAKTQSMGGCGAADQVAKDLGAEIATNDQLKMKDLPAPLQTIMTQLSIGQATPPFGSAKEGIRVLVLCGRDDAPTQAKMPTFDEVYAQMNDERVNRQAQKLLRNLRRDAIIDYR
ncbi:peptidylprolyl isomerase [Glacieibacterium sp.]|uniref:peptidylprolyl isomerase n=1 Tax=Glacieibacterium sp. TaxID=2860237 RepID=UPI003B009B7A